MTVSTESKISQKCLSFFICVTMGVILVVLVSLFVFTAIDDDDNCNQNTNRFRFRTREEVLAFYDDFFLTPDEAKAYAQKIESQDRRNSSVTGKPFRVVCPIGLTSTTEVPANKTTTPQARPGDQGPVTLRGRRASADQHTVYFTEPDTYHGCCITSRVLVSPDSLPRRHNPNKHFQLIHNGNNRQYFLSEQFEVDPNCDLNCGCSRSRITHRALVFNPDFDPSDVATYFVVREVIIPGATKCINDA